MINAALLEAVEGAIITVGEGRGFLVHRDPWPPQVITAAHCLPYLPTAHPASLTQDRAYANLLGPLGETPSLWAECVFVDPVADLAVLREPAGQVLHDENEAYETFMDDQATVRIGTIQELGAAWLLTRSGEWEQCTVQPGIRGGRTLTLVDAKHGNAPGCSGSPIVTADGRAVGVVCVGSVTVSGSGERMVQAEQSGQPMLATCLPAWLLREMLIVEDDTR